MLAAAKKHPPTFLPAVPPIYERLATAADERGIDLTATRFAISGAMALPRETLELWEDVTGGLLVEGYGLTETSPVAIGNPHRQRAPAGRGRRSLPEHRHPRRRPRGPDPGPRARRARRAAHPRTAGLRRLLGQARRDRGRPARRRLVPHRRHRRRRRRRLRLDRRPHQGDHHHRRLQRHAVGGRGRAAHHPGHHRRRGRRPAQARRQRGRRGGRDDRAGRRARRRGRRGPAAGPDLAAYKVPRRVVVVDELPRSQIGKVLRKQVRDSLIEG